MNWLQAFEGQTYEKGLALLARGHLKTCIGSTAFPLRQIIRADGNFRVGLTSCSEDVACTISGAIKEICENNEILIKAFPWIFHENIGPAVHPWRNDKFRLKGLADNVKEGTVEAFDINTPPTSRHYDLILLDDPVDRRSVEKPEIRARMRDSFDLLIPLLEPGGKRIGFGTYWHHYDLYHDIIAGRKGKDWRILHKSCVDEKGKMLWPERFTKTQEEANALKKKYFDMGIKNPKVISLESLQDDMSPSIFYAQYMLQTLPPEDVTFVPDDIIFQDPPDTGEKYYIVALDPASTAKKRSAKSAFSIISVYENKQIFGEEFVNEKLHTPEIIDLIFRYASIYPGKMIIEKTGWSDIQRIVEEEMIIRNVYFEVIWMTPKDGKIDRVKNVLELPFKRKQIKFKKCLKDNYAFNELRAQILDFPQCSMWDAIDSFTHAVSEADYTGEIIVEKPAYKPENRIQEKIDRLMNSYDNTTVWS